MCVFSSHPFWTSSSLDVPAGVTQEEGHTGFLIHLLSAVRACIFLARRIQPFLSLVDREVEFCVLRPSFMGIVFGVYRNWIWEFGDLRSYTPILWGSIWPNTIISNPIFFFFPRLRRIWDPNTMDSREIVFEGFDLKCRRVPLKVRSLHQA